MSLQDAEKNMLSAPQSILKVWHARSRATRRRLSVAAAVLTLVVLYWYRWQPLSQSSQRGGFLNRYGASSIPADSDLFEKIPVSGYVNTEIPDGPKCSDIEITGQELAVTNSMHLADNLLLIAETINHPMIDYSGQSKSLSLKEQIRQTWGRMAGSSVWLEKYQVYFTVSRVFFYTQGVKHWPVISFIRAQVYDENWNHLDNYVLPWKGQNFTYPSVLTIPTHYEPGGGFYGPEDPRIVIEEGVQDAEPVIIFNMVDKHSRRSMNIHRPFSNFTTQLNIEDENQGNSEKNWSPFFLPNTLDTDQHGQRYPSPHINFVYSYRPLQVLRCHLMNGFCRWAFNIEKHNPGWDAYKEDHKYPDVKTVLRGGTNFVSVPYESRPGLMSWIGFPRTHTQAGCGFRDALYRPVLMLLTSNGTHYWLDYVSDQLDFGNAVLTHSQSQDLCDTGRILLGNGIARYKSDKNQDVMTVSFTVADSTVQVAHVHGVRKLIESLPQMTADLSSTDLEKNVPWKLNVSLDLTECSMASADAIAIDRTPEDFFSEEELLRLAKED